jgi:rare lipoprotein A
MAILDNVYRFFALAILIVVITALPVNRKLQTETAAATPAPGALFQQIGTASWYGPGFAGKRTASGSRFNPRHLTAAHRSLPLGTKAHIVNLDNGLSVEVTVTDRGPYVGDRVIDLSERAAKALGMMESGLAHVAIEVSVEELG